MGEIEVSTMDPILKQIARKYLEWFQDRNAHKFTAAEFDREFIRELGELRAMNTKIEAAGFEITPKSKKERYLAVHAQERPATVREQERREVLEADSDARTGIVPRSNRGRASYFTQRRFGNGNKSKEKR